MNILESFTHQVQNKLKYQQLLLERVSGNRALRKRVEAAKMDLTSDQKNIETIVNFVVLTTVVRSIASSPMSTIIGGFADEAAITAAVKKYQKVTMPAEVLESARDQGKDGLKLPAFVELRKEIAKAQGSPAGTLASVQVTAERFLNTVFNSAQLTALEDLRKAIENDETQGPNWSKAWRPAKKRGAKTKQQELERKKKEAEEQGVPVEEVELQVRKTGTLVGVPKEIYGYIGTSSQGGLGCCAYLQRTQSGTLVEVVDKSREKFSRFCQNRPNFVTLLLVYADPTSYGMVSKALTDKTRKGEEIGNRRLTIALKKKDYDQAFDLLKADQKAGKFPSFINKHITENVQFLYDTYDHTIRQMRRYMGEIEKYVLQVGRVKDEINSQTWIKRLGKMIEVISQGYIDPSTLSAEEAKLGALFLKHFRDKGLEITSKMIDYYEKVIQSDSEEVRLLRTASSKLNKNEEALTNERLPKALNHDWLNVPAGKFRQTIVEALDFPDLKVKKEIETLLRSLQAS